LPLLSARPAVTFPAAEHHRPLAGTKLYCEVTEAHIFHPLQYCAVVFVSHSFNPCIFVPLIPFSQFSPMHFGAVVSILTISTPAILTAPLFLVSHFQSSPCTVPPGAYAPFAPPLLPSLCFKEVRVIIVNHIRINTNYKLFHLPYIPIATFDG